MRPLRLALVVSLLGLAGFACKKTRCLDPATDTEVEARKEDVEALAKVVEKDPKMCSELAAPRVAVEPDKLVIYGATPHEIARRSELPLDVIHSIDPLKQRLIAYRTLWKTLHPAADFPSSPEVVIDAKVEMTRALSVTNTLAVAGYRHQRVVVGDVEVTVDWWVPHLADGPYPTRHILDVKIVEDGVAMMRLRKPSCVTTEWEKVFPNPDGIAKVVTRLCDGDEHCPRYTEVRAPKGHRFRQAMLVVRDLVGARAKYEHDPADEEIALMISGSNPKIFAPGISAPETDGAAYCLPDGGTADTLPLHWAPAPR